MTTPTPGDADPFEGQAALNALTGGADPRAGVVPRRKGDGRWTDTMEAEHLAGVLNRLMHVPEVGWFQWDDTRWAPIDEGILPNAIAQFYRLEATNAAQRAADETAAGHTRNADRAFTEVKMARKYQAATKVRDVLYLLKSRVALPWDGDTAPGARLDCNPPGKHLLNTPDGIVDLDTGDVGEHDPELLITKITAGRYRPDYVHADWQAAQESLPAETLEWMRLRMGYAITGEQSRDMVFLNGQGKNGKSLFTNDGILRALGSYGLLLSNTVIAQHRSDPSAASPDRASLRGIRFALIEELDDESGFNLSTTALKQLVGTGAVTARKLFKDTITFENTWSIFVNTNHVPTVVHTDVGTWRRLTLVHFPWRFSTTPTGDLEKRAVTGLDRRLREGTDGQHDAMVTWLVDGARDVLRDTAPVTDIDERYQDDRRAGTVKDTTWAWRKASDRLMAYADDHLIFETDAQVARADILAHFNAWQTQNGNSKWSASLLRDRMKSHVQFRAAVEGLRRATSTTGLSRPDMLFDLPKLAARPEVYPGIRFAQESIKLVNPTPTLEEAAS
jgi:putative DNA primase/helicase